MDTTDWEAAYDGSNVLSTTESVLAQALPGSLGTPRGWRSEIIDSSSPISNDIETNLFNNNNRSFIKSHEEYQTINTSNSSPINFPSTKQTNRITNKISSSNLRSSSNINSSNPNIYTDNLIQENKTILTDEQQSTPLVIRKTLPNNTVTYEQNVSVRYLQPPTPPPPGPIIIREIRPPPPPPQSPVQIRQRPPPPATPPPIIIRERPPPAPMRPPSRIVEKLLPPPPRPPPRMIVERFAPCPPKPPDVIIERWLPYKRTDRRRVLFERAPAPFIPPREPNLLILHNQPHARIHKEFINQGVVRADPVSYIQRYGAEISSSHTHPQFAHLISEASSALPPPQPVFSTSAHHSYPGYQSPVAAVWNRMRSVSPLPHIISNHHDYSQYGSPYRYSASSPYGDHSFNDYAAHRGDFRAITDVTSSWNRNCYPSSSQSYFPSYQFSSPSSPSPYPPRTIQVNSESEFQDVLSNLTHGHIPTPLHAY